MDGIFDDSHSGVWLGGDAGPSGDSGGSAGETGQADAGADANALIGEGNVEIHVRGTTAPIAHDDGLAGQTPIAHSSGLRSFRLYHDQSDKDPLVVFDFGQQSVEASYDDGADTLIYKRYANTLPMGTYTLARVVHAYVRYRVGTTMHAYGYSIPGEFENMQVLSDNSLVDGELRSAGYYEYRFHGAGQTFEQQGGNAPIPQAIEVGGFKVAIENGELAYYFPVHIMIDPQLTQTIRYNFQVNMHESFRWQDENQTDYALNVFDSTPVGTEQVKRFGANSFEIFAQ